MNVTPDSFMTGKVHERVEDHGTVDEIVEPRADYWGMMLGAFNPSKAAFVDTQESYPVEFCRELIRKYHPHRYRSIRSGPTWRKRSVIVSTNNH